MPPNCQIIQQGYGGQVDLADMLIPLYCAKVKTKM